MLCLWCKFELGFVFEIRECIKLLIENIDCFGMVGVCLVFVVLLVCCWLNYWFDIIVN